MRVLVSGGTGVVGRETVTRLVAQGHLVRLVSRGAAEDSREWDQGVEAHPADISDASAIRGAADGCEAVLHLAGIERENPPDVTFQKVNVQGTQVLLDEAARAGVRRFVYVSSLGAERGESDYHRSKRSAEKLVERYPREWLICRLANVYGPGDAVISVLLRWMRTVPVLPLLDDGETEFQPIWVEDAAEALLQMVEREGLAGRVLEVAGEDRTSLSDLVERIGGIIDRRPVTVPVPSGLVSFAAWAGQKVGIELPVDPGQVTMLNEGSVVRSADGNGLHILEVRSTPLDDGLRKLADVALEQLPDEGVGGLEHKRFSLVVENAGLDAAALMGELCSRLDEFTPWTLEMAPEPDTPETLAEGRTITMGLPGRGNVQVRVAELTDTSLTMVTLEGHPLAGAVRISAEDTGTQALRLQVEVFDRSSGLLDWILMRTAGSPLQDYTWETLLLKLAEAAGGEPAGEVGVEVEELESAEARSVEEWLKGLVQRRRREEHNRRGARAD